MSNNDQRKVVGGKVHAEALFITNFQNLDAGEKFVNGANNSKRNQTDSHPSCYMYLRKIVNLS